MCQVSLKRLEYSPRIFEKKMYNPRNVAYKSTALVYLRTKITEKATRIGEQKKHKWPQN